MLKARKNMVEVVYLTVVVALYDIDLLFIHVALLHKIRAHKLQSNIVHTEATVYVNYIDVSKHYCKCRVIPQNG